MPDPHPGRAEASSLRIARLDEGPGQHILQIPASEQCMALHSNKFDLRGPNLHDPLLQRGQGQYKLGELRSSVNPEAPIAAYLSRFLGERGGGGAGQGLVHKARVWCLRPGFSRVRVWCLWPGFGASGQG